MSPEDDSSSSRLMKPRWSQEGRAGAEHLLALEKLPGPWKTRRLLSTTSSPLREPARRAAWRCRHVTMHTALWRTRSLLLPPLSEAWAAPRSPTQPPSPFVYALTQSRCVSSCLVFINVLRAQRSRSHGASSHIHPSRTPLAPVGLKGAGELGPLFSSFLYFILLLLLFFFNSCTLISHIPSSTDREGGEGLDFHCAYPRAARNATFGRRLCPRPGPGGVLGFIFPLV